MINILFGQNFDKESSKKKKKGKSSRKDKSIMAESPIVKLINSFETKAEQMKLKNEHLKQ